MDVVEALEQLRVRMITDMFQGRRDIPVPRPPLKSRPPMLDQARLGFAKYLVEQGKISEQA